MMYDTVDTVYDCIRIATGVLSTLRLRPERMLKGESMNYLHAHRCQVIERDCLSQGLELRTSKN